MRKGSLLLLALAVFFSAIPLSRQQSENETPAIARDVRSKSVPTLTTGRTSLKIQPPGDPAGLPDKKDYTWTDHTYVAVPQLDYRFFQEEMTDEEWEDLTLYFPLLKEGALFELTDSSSAVRYDRNGEIIAGEGNTAFYQFTPREMTDLQAFPEYYDVDDMGRGKIMEVILFDMDGDSVRELILQWTPRMVGDYLILHYEDGNYYGFLIPMRGFCLQTSGVFTSGSGGNRYYRRLLFEDGHWMEELLAEERLVEYHAGSMEVRYYVSSQSVDEDTFTAYTEACETGDVTAYRPRERRDGGRHVRPMLTTPYRTFGGLHTPAS